MFENKVILITGGSGSWGQELTRKLLPHRPKEIRIFSRNRRAQLQMKMRFGEQTALQYTIGDVRDASAVREACAGVDYVFHLAALKHVPICEWQPEEAIKTNIHGTENVIAASIAHKVKKVIDISTDKAADPINFYGMTKSIGEKLMVKSNDSNSATKFVCIRGGNVLGSNGSVVPFFMKQITEGQDVTLTSMAMTRFFLTLSEAIDLVLMAAQETIGGETFVMRMNACKIVDLIDVLIRNLADKPVRIKDIGIRPGEKTHEVLVTRDESLRTYRYNEHYFIILPNQAAPALTSRYGGLPKVTFEQYASDDNLMTGDEIEQMLRHGGFIG
ncbi:polysaccharide biosynthesis protein [Cohnella suwonensis]|uniref:Polysaccharide biosynthesis protein n=1 Tax=Cohnella suwonensis TaxID=696072 RepID=A0ABW0LSF2_9BACL